MKNFMIKLVTASFLLTMWVPLCSCGKTTEKTTTIIKEPDAPKADPDVQLKINAGEHGVSIETK